jgi:hypothetical protein
MDKIDNILLVIGFSLATIAIISAAFLIITDQIKHNAMDKDCKEMGFDGVKGSDGFYYCHKIENGELIKYYLDKDEVGD